MQILESWPLRAPMSIARVDQWPPERREQAREHLSPGHAVLPKDIGVDPADLPKLDALRANVKALYHLKIALLDGDQLVGWSEGWQDANEPDTFFMAASLVLPAYRRQGFYEALTTKTLEIARRDGFQAVSSGHVVTNNPILIAKLKLGFHISGFELNARWGTMVRLIYHLNEMKEKAFAYRAGSKADPEIETVLRRT